MPHRLPSAEGLPAMFPFWAILGFYAIVPFLILRHVGERYMGGPFRFGSVRTLAILIGLAACDAGFVTWYYAYSERQTLTYLAVDTTILAATITIAALTRLTVGDAFALSWILSAATTVLWVVLRI